MNTWQAPDHRSGFRDKPQDSLHEKESRLQFPNPPPELMCKRGKQEMTYNTHHYCKTNRLYGVISKQMILELSGILIYNWKI